MPNVTCTRLLATVRTNRAGLIFVPAHGASPVAAQQLNAHANVHFPSNDEVVVACQPGRGPTNGVATRLFPATWGAIIPQGPLRLQYSVQFEPGFDFVRGGKLPGLKVSTPAISQRRTYRPMWRRFGVSELYLHTPWDVADETLRPDHEMGRGFNQDSTATPPAWYELRSVGRGEGRFLAGEWITVDLEVVPGPNGATAARLWLDKIKVASCIESDLPNRRIPGFGTAVFDTSPIDCIHFCVFFGGDADEYDNPRRQEVQIADMQLFGI